MSFSNNKGGFSEINITPFVDVMLVLLIIFMVTTPMIQQGEKIELPKTDSALLNDDNNKHITLTIDKLKTISVDGEKVNYDKLDTILENHKVLQLKKEIFLEADKNIPYGFVLKVIAKIRNSGIPKVNLITESED